MKTGARFVVGVAVVVGGLSMLNAQACTLASPTYITSQPGLESAAADGGAGGASSPTSSGPASSSGGATCGTGDFVKADLGKLTACGNGHGHCFDKTKTPMAEGFVACPNANEVCVPDEILSAGGKPLKSCTSVIGPGGCITASLIPELEKRAAGALKQDVCDATQVCAPCSDPTNGNAPTPFCVPIGVHEKPCAAGTGGAGSADGGATKTAAQGCCTTKGKSNGVCITETVVPEAQRDKTIQDTCPDANKCVPVAFVENKPVKCDGGLLGPGVCMDKCFNGMMSLAGDIGFLNTEGCGDTEVCVPCRFVKDQGAPGCT